jgi:hypothetical protein
VSAVLLVRLRITDLVAWTALDAGRRLLPAGHELTRLTREQLLLFEPERGGGAASFEADLARAVTESNFFVNPNKESYRFLRASERGRFWEPPAGAWGILTRSREDTRDEGLLARLTREHPLPGLQAIRRARAYWIWTRGPGGDSAVGASFEALGEARGTHRGLLLNPHAEASLLIEERVTWTDVETFLKAAPPAYRTAA